MAKVMKTKPTHVFIPDTQVKPGVPTDHISWAGEEIASRKPDVIVQIGDWADMASLSSYDKGKYGFEDRRYEDDVVAAQRAWDLLDTPIRKVRGYRPRKVLTLGNHEARISRVLETEPYLMDRLMLTDVQPDGWEVYDFLEVVWIDGVAYSHYFYNPMSGRPYGGTIDNRLKQIGHTFSMGHQQTFLTGMRYVAGIQQRGLVAGAFYLHDEDYKGPQGNAHWRGIIFKHEVSQGQYDIMELSMDYLCRKYEGMELRDFLKKKYRRNSEGLWLPK